MAAALTHRTLLAEARKDYARGIGECAEIFAKIEDGIGQRGKVELTARCLQTVREEAERWER